MSSETPSTPRGSLDEILAEMHAANPEVDWTKPIAPYRSASDPQERAVIWSLAFIAESLADQTREVSDEPQPPMPPPTLT